MEIKEGSKSKFLLNSDPIRFLWRKLEPLEANISHLSRQKNSERGSSIMHESTLMRLAENYLKFLGVLVSPIVPALIPFFSQ